MKLSTCLSKSSENNTNTNTNTNTQILQANDFVFMHRLDNVNLFKLLRYINETNLGTLILILINNTNTN